MLEFLAGLAAIHQSVIDKINARQARAKVNQGSTEPARSVPSNSTSRMPGPHKPEFSSPEKSQEHLAWVKQERE
jgi:hypothetical protein